MWISKYPSTFADGSTALISHWQLLELRCSGVIRRWLIRECPSLLLLDAWFKIHSSHRPMIQEHTEWTMWIFCPMETMFMLNNLNGHLNYLSWNGSGSAGQTMAYTYRNKASVISFIFSNNKMTSLVGIWTAWSGLLKYTIL